MGIPSELMKFYRKRAFLPATSYEVEGPDGFTIGVSRDEGDAPELDGGGVAAPPRKPLVAQSTPATVSGDDNDERGRGILAELSQGIDVNERAALNDPRARAEAQDARNRSDRMSNIMLQSAGLQPLTKQDDPYVSERDKMRDWLMKRAGVAGRNETAGLNAERTKAYLDSIQASRERDLAAQKLRAEAEGRKADAEKFDRALKEAEAKRKAEKDASEKALAERGLKLKEDAAKRKGAPKPAAPELPPDEVAFGDTVFQFQGGAGTPKEARNEGAKEMRRKSAQWNQTIAGLSQLEDALTKFIKDPSPSTRSMLYGPALTAAGSTNAAIGQGAMSQDEKAAQFQALGVSMGDAEGISNLIERAFGNPQAAADVVKRVQQMKKLAHDSVAAVGQPWGYLPKGASSTPAVAAPSAPGKVRVSNGKETLEIDAADVKAAEAEGYRRVP